MNKHMGLFGMACGLAALGLAGCHSVPRDAGFAEVKKDVYDRISKDIQWTREKPEQSAVADKVGAVLSQELSSDAAVQIALLNNRNLQATFQSLGIAQADLVQAGLFKNPRFNGQYLPAIGSGAEAAVGLDLAINFLDFFYVPLRKRIAEAQFAEARKRVASEVLKVAGQTRMAYYALQRSQQLVELRQTELQSAAAAATAMQGIHDAGNATDLALEQERDARDQAKLGLAKAEADIVEARERLNRLMGLWGAQADGWKCQPRMPSLPASNAQPEDLEKKAIQANLELAASRERIEALARQAGFSSWEAVLPEIELGVVGDREDDGTWHAGPGLSIPIPIFDQGQSRKAAEKAKLRMALENHAALAISVRSQARALWHKQSSAYQAAHFLKSVVLPRRERIAAHTLLAYNAMQLGVFQLLEAQRNVVHSGKDYVESLHEYWSAQAELELLLAGVLLAPESAQESSRE